MQLAGHLKSSEEVTGVCGESTRETPRWLLAEKQKMLLQVVLQLLGCVVTRRSEAKSTERTWELGFPVHNDLL